MRDNYKQIVSRVALAMGLFLSVFASMAVIGPAVHAAEPEAVGFPVYKPPLRGVPTARVGGGTRGGGDVATEIYVLTPEHMGRSAYS